MLLDRRTKFSRQLKLAGILFSQALFLVTCGLLWILLLPLTMLIYLVVGIRHRIRNSTELVGRDGFMAKYEIVLIFIFIVLICLIKYLGY